MGTSYESLCIARATFLIDIEITITGVQLLVLGLLICNKDRTGVKNIGNHLSVL